MKNARSAYRAVNRKLLISCASLAVAAALLHPAPAARASSTARAGGCNRRQHRYARHGDDQVTNSAATIDWQANAGNDFLPSTSTPNFTSSSGVNDYTVSTG